MSFFYLGWALILPLAWIWHRKQALHGEIASLRMQLKSQEELHEEKMKFVLETKEKLSESFKVFSYEAMEKFQKHSDAELQRKEEALLEKLRPVKEGLLKLDEGMRTIEKERKGEKEVFKEQIQSILQSEKDLRDETANLVKALRKPDVRGMWGELQLRRVVELAGMLNYCDFSEQNSMSAEEGRFRPDMIVKLPGDKQVIVDSKAPFEAFLEANQTEDPKEKEEKLKTHARHLRQHVLQLAKKSYWSRFQPSPEFVVLFLPAEVFFQAALQYDPTIVEIGAEQGVIIATPTTLIGLLRAIAHGWKQDLFSKHAQQISDLGHELYKRLGDMGKHFAQVGKSLNTAAEAYNKAMGSYERRVLVSARKFQDFGAASKEVDLEALPFIESTIPKKEEEKELLLE